MTDKPLIAVTSGDLPSGFPAAFEGRVLFQPAHTDEELRTLVRKANILYSWQIPQEVPAETPQLRWIELPSAGADHVRNHPVWNSSITLTSSKGVHTVPMAEHLFAMLLALTRQITAMTRAQDRGEWTRGRQLRLRELRGSTMGIVGWGKIGDGIAHLASAFGMRVIGTRWSVLVPREAPRSASAFADPPWLEPPDNPPDVVYPAAQSHEVLAQSDVVVLLLPLTDQTRGSFGDAEFRAMRRGALFFNLGRGPVVDEDALIRHLQSGRLGGAGLDVFSHEPLQRASPLWAMPNVIVSPHVGGVGEQTRERAAWLFAVNLTRYLEGQPLLNLVDRAYGY